MAGTKGSKRRGRRPGQKVKAAVSGSKRAGIIFPVGRCNSKIRKGRFARRVSMGAGCFMAGVLEYLTCEILDLAGQCASEHKKKQIKPRHLLLAIRNDDELNKLMCATQISQGGVLPNGTGTMAELWPKSKYAAK